MEDIANTEPDNCNKLIPLFNPFSLADKLMRVWISFPDVDRAVLGKLADLLLESEKVITLTWLKGSFDFVADFALDADDKPVLVVENCFLGFHDIARASIVAYPRQIFRWMTPDRNSQDFPTSSKAPLLFSADKPRSSFTTKEANFVAAHFSDLPGADEPEDATFGEMIPRLQNKGLIAAHITSSHFPDSCFRVVLRLEDGFFQEKEDYTLDVALSCCYQFKNVVSLTHLRGEWHLEFVLSAKNEKEVAQFVKGLKTQFASHLINVNSAQQTAHIDQSLARICRMVERAEVEPKLAQNVRRM